MDENNQQFRRAVNHVVASIKLKTYQLQVSETIIAFMGMHLQQNNIPMTSSDREIIEMYEKVMNSDNVEQAEAYFIGLADKFCNTLGFGDFESLKNNYSSFLEEDNNNTGDN